MKKRSRKLVSILLTLAMLATLLLPMAAPALAGGTITALTTPVVADADEQVLGTIKVVVPAGAISSGDSVIFKLPSGWDFDDPGYFSETPVDTNPTGNVLYVPDNVGDDLNGLQVEDITVNRLDDNDEVQITATNNQEPDLDFVFYVYLKDVNVEEDTTGECVVTFDGPSGSGFPSGTVTVAKVSASGSLTLSVSGADESNNEFNFDLRVKEDVLGSLEVDSESVTLILPDGYEWDANEGTVTQLWGDATPPSISIDVNDDGDELYLVVTGSASSSASAWDVTGLTFTVADEKKAKAGDVVVKVKGESTSSPSTLVVGTYGEYGATISAKGDVPTVYAGQVEQEVADLVIKESIAESLVDGRYITLTLPSFAKWTTVPDEIENESVTLEFAGVSGSEGNVIKYTIDHSGGGDPAELEFEDMEILLDVAPPGDLKVTIGGTSGIEGEVVIAKVANAVTVAAASKPEVKIGMAAQKIGDITITEAEAGAIEEGTLVLKVPAGTEFAKLPKVEVVSGDIDIDFAQISRAKPASTDHYQFLNIPIDGDSNEVSTIKISDIYVTVDRTVAEGDLKVAVLGSAVLVSNAASTNTAGTGAPLVSWFNGSVRGDIDGDNAADYTVTQGTSLFPATAALTAAAAGVVVTPAPGETKASASFVIGSTTYKVGGVEMTMDVAPYVKDGRTYLPVRYVAQALGVADANIIWNEATQTVTLLKGDKVVQLKIGSKDMLVNGVTISMDVPAEITGGRTMLPFRFIAQAFGATVGWDEATQTVTLN